MAIPLISPLERARKAILQVLQDHLPTELATMQTEDPTLTLPSVVKWEVMEAIDEPSEVILEVLASSLLVLDTGRVQYGQGKLTTQVVVEVGCVVLRDINWTDHQFLDVLDRCAAAVIRTITLRHSNLDQSSQQVHGAFPGGTVRYEADKEDDPGGRLCRRVVVPFTVQMRETLT